MLGKLWDWWREKRWWRGKDSNLRRQSRQIYSLIPLAAREPLHGVFSWLFALEWWREKDSNLRRQSRQIYSLIPLAARESLLKCGANTTRIFRFVNPESAKDLIKIAHFSSSAHFSDFSCPEIQFMTVFCSVENNVVSSFMQQDINSNEIVFYYSRMQRWGERERRGMY